MEEKKEFNIGRIAFKPDASSKFITDYKLAKLIGAVFSQITSDYEGASIMTDANHNVYADLYFKNNMKKEGLKKFIHRIGDIVDKNYNIIDMLSAVSRSSVKSLELTEDGKNVLKDFLPPFAPNSNTRYIDTKSIFDKETKRYKNEMVVNWKNVGVEVNKRSSSIGYIPSTVTTYLVVPINLSLFLASVYDEYVPDTKIRYAYKVSLTGSPTTQNGTLLLMSRFNPEALRKSYEEQFAITVSDLGFIRP